MSQMGRSADAKKQRNSISPVSGQTLTSNIAGQLDSISNHQVNNAFMDADLVLHRGERIIPIHDATGEESNIHLLNS